MQAWIEDPSKVPKWLILGRTVICQVKRITPVSCLNTSYKIFTGILGQHVKKQVIQKDLWNKSQMRTCEKVLGTVDQLLIDSAIMGEVRDHHRSLAVAYYEYQKAQGMIYHDWTLRVYE